MSIDALILELMATAALLRYMTEKNHVSDWAMHSWGFVSWYWSPMSIHTSGTLMEADGVV